MSNLRGHAFYFEKGKWFYSDTRTPTLDEHRDYCGFCGHKSTIEGHDACLGTLPECVVMNACCGHGQAEDAYVQFWNEDRIQGEEAVEMIRELRGK